MSRTAVRDGGGGSSRESHLEIRDADALVRRRSSLPVLVVEVEVVGGQAEGEDGRLELAALSQPVVPTDLVAPLERPLHRKGVPALHQLFGCSLEASHDAVQVAVVVEEAVEWNGPDAQLDLGGAVVRPVHLLGLVDSPAKLPVSQILVLAHQIPLHGT